jgi:hypothetical protein
MHLGGQLTHLSAALGRRQPRIGQRPDQRVPVQRDLPRPVRRDFFLGFDIDSTSTLPVIDSNGAIDPDAPRRSVTDAGSC